ncbi:MAG: hypothetical protein JXB88_05295 [Spirochaetales bacterium]|nr:hypothetical protein [Spirochaetales bacterium]
MKKTKSFQVIKPQRIPKEPIKNILKEEGKFLHGTRGKPTRGPRGHKKY